MSEQTRTLSIVGRVTNIVLGVAIGLGFVTAGLAYTFILPGDLGGGGGSPPAPLKIANVTQAISVMDNGETFGPLNYDVANWTSYFQTSPTGGNSSNSVSTSNQILSIHLASAGVNGNTNTYSNTNTSSNTNGATIFSIESIGGNTNGGATSFSIEPLAPGGIPAQMVTITYALAGETTAAHSLTICLGRTDASQVYVATDGSTYTNYSFGSLTGLTTSDECQAIKDRALKPISVSGVTYATEGPWPDASQVQVGRGGRLFGSVYSGSGWQTNNGVALPQPYPDDPLLLAPFVDPNVIGTTYTIPRSIFQLHGKDTNNADLTATLCVPQLTFRRNADSTYTSTRFFFDTTGTPYKDIFLQQPAMTTKCTDIIAKELKVNSVESATGSTIIDATHGIYLYNKGQLKGVINGRTWTPTNNGEIERNYVPLTLALGGGTSTDVVKVPQVIVTMSYNSGTQKALCFPGIAAATPGKYLVYYDLNGVPYSDFFLTQKLTCASASGGTVPKKTSS